MPNDQTKSGAPNETENGTENVLSTEDETKHIASTRIKLTPFWISNPTIWFAQAEAQFSVCQITSDATKFFHVVASLPQEVCESISELVTNPPIRDKYQTLKIALSNRHTISEERRLEKLLDKAELGDRKPSEVYWSMRTLAGETFDSKLIKTLWMRKMPQTVYITITAMGDKSMEEILPIADKIYEATALNINAVNRGPQPGPSKIVTSTVENRLARIETLLANCSVNPTQRYRGRSKSPNWRSRSRFRRDHSNDRGNNKTMCYYHKKFGTSARRCYKPCYFRFNNQKVETEPKNE